MRITMHLCPLAGRLHIKSVCTAISSVREKAVEILARTQSVCTKYKGHGTVRIDMALPHCNAIPSLETTLIAPLSCFFVSTLQPLASFE